MGDSPAAAGRSCLAVIGAGVAGCALVAQLRRLGWGGSIGLWETGRGAGGRAGSRRSRRDPGLCIDHGAPLFNIEAGPRAEPPPALLEPLLAAGAIEPWRGELALLRGEDQLQLGVGDPLTSGALYAGRGGMDQLAAGLLALAVHSPDQPPGPSPHQSPGHGASAGPPQSLQTHFATFVRHLQPRPGGGWRLLGGAGELLGESDWLVLSGTLLAHPRSLLLLDWPEVPLQAAAAALGDLQLDHALTTIAGIRSEARSNLLLVLPAAAAAPWLALPFRLLSYDAAAQQRWGLRRVSIQPQADGRCAVVAHSSAAFAADHLDVVGSRSAIARQLQLSADSGREETVIAALQEALQQSLAPWLPAGAVAAAADRQLMRWGAAFPLPPGLPPELALCPTSRLGFCGDYIAGRGFGRIEGALRSGERLAARLLPLLAG